ncbi:MAG: hypothetical protein JNJ65_14320 [Cyclobacteriaceae bacterium]|jgi:hypothetical protein|nr:hypothetical protein [Cyclobacteriaceae bacterium]
MKYFLSLIFFSGLLLACTSPQHDQDPDTIAVKPADTLFSEEVIPIKPPVQKDTLLDNLARFIAGLPQLDSNSFTALETDAYWEQFKISMDFNWEKMYKNRLGKIEHWQDSVFAPLQNDSLVLFYPFSGPDFLHAYYLYPDAPVYVLAALEPIIEVPALDTVRVPKRDHFLDSLGRSLRDIFQKSYFITNHMQKDLKAISGVLPPLYFFLERTGHELLRQQYITLDSAGQESIVEYKKLHWQTTQGVKLIFRNLESKKVKTLYYFSASISNGGLRDRPEFVRFISEQAPFNTFVKSASYLLHNSQFTEIKDIILTHSDNIFQDDTGIPFKDFKKQLNRTVHLFGTYTKPIKDFGEVRYQPDLDSAYKVSANRTPLPFSLGYHWGTAQQHYMLVRKTRMETR